MSSHFARATGSEMRTFRKSGGTLCTAPGEIAFLLMDFILIRCAVGLGVLDALLCVKPVANSRFVAKPVRSLTKIYIGDYAVWT